MDKAIKMKALMSLPARGERRAVGVGEPFSAASEQEARDLVQMGRAQRATAEQAAPAEKPAPPEKPAK